jgi:hypothetical protein
VKINEANFTNWGIIRWKTINWAEYKKFQDSTNYKGPMAVVNDIYRACVISGPNYQDVTAGVAEFIAADVFKNNAFSGSYEVLIQKLENSRQELNDNFLLSARAIISSIFGYKFEEMDAWDEDTFMLRLAQAEFVAGKPVPINKEEVQPSKSPTPINEHPDRLKKELSPAQRLVMDRIGKR